MKKNESSALAYTIYTPLTTDSDFLLFRYSVIKPTDKNNGTRVFTARGDRIVQMCTLQIHVPLENIVKIPIRKDDRSVLCELAETCMNRSFLGETYIMQIRVPLKNLVKISTN